MANVTNRDELKYYCLRKLGFPVIEINVDDDQVEDRIDDAFQFFFDYHFDGVEKMYYAHQLTQEDLDTNSIQVPDSLMSIISVLPYGAGNSALSPMGDPSLSWRGNNPMMGMYSGSTTGNVATRTDQAGTSGGFDMVGYYLTRQYYDQIQSMFSGGEMPIRFNRHTNRVYIDADVSSGLSVDSYILIEGWATLDPDVYTDVYNDRWLKRYLTALIKMQWGANLIKYSGISLPGGVTLDGDKIYQDAQQEIEKLEEEMQLKYEEPVSFFMG